MRPALTSAARRLWRDPETLQLGRPPGRAVVLAGVDAAVRRVLGLLDGTRDRAALVGAAAAAGCPPDRTEHVLSLLEAAGVLEDAAADRGEIARLPRAERDRLAADLASLRLVRHGDALSVVRRRLGARVVVDGAGRVGAAVAAVLAAAGVGSVDVVDDGVTRPEDCGIGGLPLTAVGSRRGDAARALLTLPAREPGTILQLPDLVVLAPPTGLPVPQPPQLVPHLAAEVRGAVGVVGPLVQPGESACLHCLDLTRTDRDPGWPTLAVQLDAPAPAVAPCDSGLALAVAAQTALQVLSFLDGGDVPTLGGTLELALPDWRWRRRSWQIHPDCECGWRRTG